MGGLWQDFCLNLKLRTEAEGKNRHINNRLFAHSSRPFIIFVNPARIVNYTRAAHPVGIKKIGYYFVEGGSWDLEANSIMINRHYREIADIYQHLNDYKKSSSYQESLDELKKGIIRKFHDMAFTNIAMIDRYFERQMNLIKSIRQNGYLTRANIINSGLYENFEGQQNKQQKRLKGEREIGVVIDRNGQLIFFRTGHHRLSAVTCLKIPRVPVEVFFVHKNWFQENARQKYGYSFKKLLHSIREVEKNHQ